MLEHSAWYEPIRQFIEWHALLTCHAHAAVLYNTRSVAEFNSCICLLQLACDIKIHSRASCCNLPTTCSFHAGDMRTYCWDPEAYKQILLTCSMSLAEACIPISRPLNCTDTFTLSPCTSAFHLRPAAYLQDCADMISASR